VHEGKGQFLCSSAYRPRAGNEIPDGRTQWNGIHVCPPNMAMTGWNESKNQLLCESAGRLGEQAVDNGTQRDGMHACPTGKVMVGINAQKNLLVCSRPM
jgi:hypothetical protein